MCDLKIFLANNLPQMRKNGDWSYQGNRVNTEHRSRKKEKCLGRTREVSVLHKAMGNSATGLVSALSQGPANVL